MRKKRLPQESPALPEELRLQRQDLVEYWTPERMAAAQGAHRIVPATHPYGGWAAYHTREAVPFDPDAPPVHRPSHTDGPDLWLLTAAQPAHDGLRRLLAARTGRAPKHIDVVTRPCPSCDLPHTSAVDTDPPLYYAFVSHGDLALCSVSTTPTGLGLALPGSEEAADRKAYSQARRGAQWAAGARCRLTGQVHVWKTAHVLLDTPHLAVVVWRDDTVPPSPTNHREAAARFHAGPLLPPEPEPYVE
ncbi:hypothetical protein HLK59_04335 [Streptomyces sp. S3(2020)]|uniref:hypothetical protein n=1 Tax=Streptomyces sp. S3(2020) TaxID=2732044 RepID=UPI00148A0FD5|nr:hypothetical protein [Streptomyces sp. S3(2020)]NNN29597.1 hypothetical protein [Streptomyces sp. S3(2020)]